MNDHEENKLHAIIGIGGVLLSVVILIISAKTRNTVLTLIGVIIFVLAIAAGIIIERVTEAADKAKHIRELSGGSAKATSKYHLLLIDERTKQDPDVQRLLQYPTVQKAFFDPNYISSASAQNDPYVRELIEVFERMLDGGGANGDFGDYGNVNQMSAYVSELKKRDTERQAREKNKPRRTVGTVLSVVGILLFMVPFIAIVFGPSTTMFAYAFAAAPLGMILAFIGNILKRKK